MALTGLLTAACVAISLVAKAVVVNTVVANSDSNNPVSKSSAFSKRSVGDPFGFRALFTLHTCEPNASCGGFGQCDPQVKETCRCQQGYEAVGQQCAKASFALSTGCLDDPTCGPNSRCDKGQGRCVCLIEHLVPQGLTDRCEPVYFRDSTCVSRGGCGERLGVCQTERCYCKHGYFAAAGMCVKAIFKPKQGCIVDADCGPDATCGFECKCKVGSFAFGRQCVTTSFRTEPCLGECDGGKGRCDGSTCRCENDFFASRNTCVTVTFRPRSGFCPRAGLCGAGRGICESDDITCRCMQGYFAHNEICVQESFEAKECASWRVFTCGEGNGHCSKTGATCLCMPGYLAYEGTCVRTSYVPVNGNCSSLHPCGAHATCERQGNSEMCHCEAGNMAIGKQCGVRHFTLLTGCTVDQDCGDNAECLMYSSSGTCICRPSFLVISQRCVTPFFLNANCTQRDGQTCGGGNGQCTDGKCYCDAGFYASDQACVARDELEFSEQMCSSKESGCQNGVCRSRQADWRFSCLCYTGYRKDPVYRQEMRHCVPGLPAPIAQEAAGTQLTSPDWLVAVLVILAVLTNLGLIQ